MPLSPGPAAAPGSLPTWKPEPRSSRWLPRVNNVLLVLVILTNLYVISVPFIPQALFFVNKHAGQQKELEEALKPGSPIPVASGSATAGGQPSQGNRLIIPSMILDQTVVEGTNMYRALDQGVWRWPGGSTPDKGGNTVMLAHRFTYTQPKGVFYFLDKVKAGDDIGIIWNDERYVYTVKQTKVVTPRQTEILSPTVTPTLTLYTCTPLWLPKNRLVVVAELKDDPAASRATPAAAAGNGGTN